ncbi:WhiB family transcriptional regulator [Arthrobacter sp. M4]|uniref:WhiB family transcriptional regulator n=1 Tax=Arthrobacter sp. M4 TaxID=218160 RepID=UPI0021F0744C|nr:WhiB family transcriptional regulator [Arthrobacter sp. M4]
MGHAVRIQEDEVAVGAASAYLGRGVPGDWYVDPADPEAANRFDQAAHESLEDQATAFLAAHEALLPEHEDDDVDDDDSGSFTGLAQPVWIGLPKTQDFDDEGELGWQTDALCAQTDPEAFFPEKGGSTRDAKKVCGACNVRSQCLEYALANDERFGIWGGLSERERRRLRKRAV